MVAVMVGFLFGFGLAQTYTAIVEPNVYSPLLAIASFVTVYYAVKHESKK